MAIEKKRGDPVFSFTSKRSFLHKCSCLLLRDRNFPESEAHSAICAYDTPNDSREACRLALLELTLLTGFLVRILRPEQPSLPSLMDR